MFNLEKSITDWRNQMRTAGVAPAPVEELETHLREDINHLLAAGKSGEEAFFIAAVRVGKPRAVVAEFDKTKTGWPRPMIIGSFVWAVIAALFLALLVARYANGKLSLLLVVHIFTITAGYCTAFLAGALGIYHMLGRRNQITGTTSLTRAMAVCLPVSAAFAVVGLLTGTVWSSQNLGHLWTNDPREIGALCVIVWFVTLSLMQNRGRLTLRRAAQLGLIGNMLVALAWFGANAVHRGYGMAVYGPLDAFLGVHLFLLGMTMTRNSNAVET